MTSAQIFLFCLFVESVPVKISQEQEKDLLGEENVLEEKPAVRQEQIAAGSNQHQLPEPEVQNNKLSIESTVHVERNERKTPAKQINTRASAKRSPVAASTNLPAPPAAAPPIAAPLVEAPIVESPKVEAPLIEAIKPGPTKKKLFEAPKPRAHSETENETDSVQLNSDDTRSHIESDSDCTVATTIDNLDQLSEYSEPTQIIQSQDTQSSSQLTSDETSFDNELNYDELDADDSDEDSERRNPKTCVERSVDPPVGPTGANPSEPGRQQQPGPFNRPQRGGGHFPNMRGRFPPPYHPYRTPGNENFNPQFHPQYRPPQNHMMGGRPMHPPGPFGGPMHPYARMRPGMPLNQRLPMPPPPHGPQLHPNHPGAGPPFGFNPGGPGQMPPRAGPGPFGGPQRFPPRPRADGPNSAGGFRHPMHGAPLLPPQQQPPLHNNAVAGSAPIPQPPQLPTISGRKVLINPNFKGGVQAATSK